jgi:hypothetical protein
MSAGRDFVDMCAICKQGVLRSEMDYQKGKVFHAKCFTEHGSTVPNVDSDLAHLSARTRIELVQLKNLKLRTDLEEPEPGAARPRPAKRKKQAARKKAKKPARKAGKKSKAKKVRAKPKKAKAPKKR